MTGSGGQTGAAGGTGGVTRDGGAAGRGGATGGGGIGGSGGAATGVAGATAGRAGTGTGGAAAGTTGGAAGGTTGGGTTGGGTTGGGTTGGGTTGGGGVSDAGTDRGPLGDAGPDGGADAAPACDPIRQTGCLAGAKCGVPPGCFTNGTIGRGMTCALSGFDDCAAPDICVGDGVGHVCRQVCGVSADCTQPAFSAGPTAEPGNVAFCLIALTSSTFSTCTLACNPVPKAGASGCPTGYACGYFHTSAVPELTDCEPMGSVAEGGDCTSTACGAGLVCVSTSTTNRCRQVCRAGTTADCDVAGDTCVAPSGITSPMFGFCCAATGC